MKWLLLALCLTVVVFCEKDENAAVIDEGKRVELYYTFCHGLTLNYQ